MTASNRVRLSLVRESTIGTTPNTPTMRTIRYTKEKLSFSPDYIDPDEIRSDRMLDAPIKVMQAAKGSIDFELTYPDDNSPLSEIIRCAMYSAWVNTPTFDNAGVADSVVTDAGTTANTYTVASGGTAVKVGHLVRASGFTNAANNQVFRAASSTATTIVGTSLGLVAEAVPPGTAKLKVAGFQGASGDITATASGLGSTALDFTTLGLAVGQWIKIGGSGAGNQFATGANNDWARVTAIAATALTLDNLPSGWAIDTGTGKTIKVWFGDQIRNGTTQSSYTIEEGYMGQTTPTYRTFTGMVVDQLQLDFKSRNKITGTVSFVGMGGGTGTSSLGTPIAGTSGKVMASNANVGRVAEAGAQIVGKNFVQEMSMQFSNNLRTQESIDSTSPVGVIEGEFTATGKVTTYYDDGTLLAKLYSGTLSSISLRANKNSQALIFQLPSVTYRDGDPNVGGKNQDVTLTSNISGSLDATTGVSALIDRLEYYE